MLHLGLYLHELGADKAGCVEPGWKENNVSGADVIIRNIIPCAKLERKLWTLLDQDTIFWAMRLAQVGYIQTSAAVLSILHSCYLILVTL